MGVDISDTITDPYFVNAADGEELKTANALLVRPSAETDVWEGWYPCGQMPGEADDKLYQSKWYRRRYVGTRAEVLEAMSK